MPLYWCFICQQKFETQQAPHQCPVCHEQAFEQSTEETKPETFQIYAERNLNSATTQNLDQPPAMPFIQIISSPNNYQAMEALGRQIISNMPAFLNGLNGMLQNLFVNLQSSGRSYRPATRDEIERLEKVEQVAECAVCQLEGNMPGYKLNCGHSFHCACLDPWLQRANTCPTCRSAL